MSFGKKFWLIIFILLYPATVFAQEDDESAGKVLDKALSQWKRNVAAPSYGFTVFHGSVRQFGTPIPGVASSFRDEGFLLPAVNMRFFLGKNVSKRGGFYSGIETGIFSFVSGLFPKTFSDSVMINDVNAGYIWNGSYDFHVKTDGAIVYFAAKYGLRLDMGNPLYGQSLGFEMGAGAGVYDGGVNLYVGDRRNPSAEAQLSSDRSELCLMVDLAGEYALRLGKNFRFFAKAGLNLLPLKYVTKDAFEFNNSIMSDTMINSDSEYIDYALQNYALEIDPFAFDVRVGFALSFN